MSFPEIIPFVLAAVGGIGGLANALAGMEMVDALNTKRPADNQIPNPPVTRTEFAWFLKNPGFGYWGCRRKYRDQFPHGNLLSWQNASMLWMFCFFIAAAWAFVRAR
ncbi:MAG TPA: hypothetical protein VGH17_07255 [Candidatus Acidoferrales bacterium]|jgi:hypothetical protein